MQNFKQLPSPDEIKKFVSYDPDTGIFVRIVSKNCPWTVGQRAGSVVVRGYRNVFINGKYYCEHRLAWVLMHGEIPTGMTIDHINGDKADNRICNLRLATDCQNSYYRPRKSTNTSGFKGVYQRENGKYRATITVDKRKINLGTFETKEEAYAAYCEAARKLHGEFARLY
jgi:hypothetical protein